MKRSKGTLLGVPLEKLLFQRIHAFSAAVRAMK
jgi:hypothetical protein